jgi:hypothetical protein
MGNGEEEGLISRFFGWVKRVVCTILCAWVEILCLVVFFVSVACLVVIVFTFFFIGDCIVALFTGPVAILVGIVLFIVWLVMVLVILYVLIQIGKWTEKKVLKCWEDCR